MPQSFTLRTLLLAWASAVVATAAAQSVDLGGQTWCAVADSPAAPRLRDAVALPGGGLLLAGSTPRPGFGTRAAACYAYDLAADSLRELAVRKGPEFSEWVAVAEVPDRGYLALALTQDPLRPPSSAYAGLTLAYLDTGLQPVREVASLAVDEATAVANVPELLSDAGRVYLAFAEEVLALDLADGRELWRRPKAPTDRVGVRGDTVDIWESAHAHALIGATGRVARSRSLPGTLTALVAGDPGAAILRERTGGGVLRYDAASDAVGRLGPRPTDVHLVRAAGRGLAPLLLEYAPDDRHADDRDAGDGEHAAEAAHVYRYYPASGTVVDVEAPASEVLAYAAADGDFVSVGTRRGTGGGEGSRARLLLAGRDLGTGSAVGRVRGPARPDSRGDYLSADLGGYAPVTATGSVYRRRLADCSATPAFDVRRAPRPPSAEATALQRVVWSEDTPGYTSFEFVRADDAGADDAGADELYVTRLDEVGRTVARRRYPGLRPVGAAVAHALPGGGAVVAVYDGSSAAGYVWLATFDASAALVSLVAPGHLDGLPGATDLLHLGRPNAAGQVPTLLAVGGRYVVSLVEGGRVRVEVPLEPFDQARVLDVGGVGAGRRDELYVVLFAPGGAAAYESGGNLPEAEVRRYAAGQTGARSLRIPGLRPGLSFGATRDGRALLAGPHATLTGGDSLAVWYLGPDGRGAERLVGVRGSAQSEVVAVEPFGGASGAEGGGLYLAWRAHVLRGAPSSRGASAVRLHGRLEARVPGGQGDRESLAAPCAGGVIRVETLAGGRGWAIEGAGECPLAGVSLYTVTGQPVHGYDVAREGERVYLRTGGLAAGAYVLYAGGRGRVLLLTP